MVHAGRAFVGRHFREGRLQRRLGLDLVDQAVPFAAFHPLFEGSQHPWRPNSWFGPRPVTSHVHAPPSSGPLRRWLAALGTLCRCLSTIFGCHVSTFLHPVAPPALPGFITTMGALTPAWRRDPAACSAPCGGRYLGILSPSCTNA